MNPLLFIGSILIALAGIIHVLIFAMESVLWSKPSTWQRFGIHSQDEADTVRPMAYNQGFYNLFLAIGTIGGLLLATIPAVHDAGIGIAIFAAASMVLAATVLVISNPKLARAAALQGAAPLLGLILVIAGLLLG